MAPSYPQADNRFAEPQTAAKPTPFPLSADG